MPGLDGLEATRRLLDRAAPAARVLILTTFDLDEYVYEALRAGASGFLLKSARPSELVAAVRAAVAGDTLLAPEITRRLVESFVRRPPPGTDRPRRARGRSPRRELEVLRQIARGRSNAEIARRAVRLRRDRQDPRQPDLHQARSTRPHAGGDRRLRMRTRRTASTQLAALPAARPAAALRRGSTSAKCEPQTAQLSSRRTSVLPRYSGPDSCVDRNRRRRTRSAMARDDLIGSPTRPRSSARKHGAVGNQLGPHPGVRVRLGARG